MTTTEDRARFTALFHEFSPRVLAYARRHCDAATAEDVVADTFLVAWRRFADVPADPLPWLLVTARNTLSDRRRRLRRDDRLADTIADGVRLAGQVAGADQVAVERALVLAALDELNAGEREALLLVAWEGLSNADAAVVAGCTQRAFEVRLSRARARLAREMAAAGENHNATVPSRPRITAIGKATP